MEDEVRLILREAAEQSDRGSEERPESVTQPKSDGTTAEAAPKIVVIIGGGIAAYKSLDLIRRLQERGAQLRCILTPAARHFVTPLAVGAVAGGPRFSRVFDPANGIAVGPTRLYRSVDRSGRLPAAAHSLAVNSRGP